ncbi:MAG: hypothetical protein P1V13_21335 [Rhizobiaceae bacterium]|nr:hypothetical protein [Rhizobiaceae bacterium]
MNDAKRLSMVIHAMKSTFHASSTFARDFKPISADNGIGLTLRRSSRHFGSPQTVG